MAFFISFNDIVFPFLGFTIPLSLLRMGNPPQFNLVFMHITPYDQAI